MNSSTILILLYTCLTLNITFSNSVLAQYDYDNENETPNTNNRQPGNSNNQNQENAEDSEDDVTTPKPATTTTKPVNQTTIDPIHVQSQVNQIIHNVDTFNITGIVDQSLGIRNNAPVRNLVNGILSSVFCNPFFSNINNCGRGRNAHWKRPVVNSKNSGNLVLMLNPSSSST